MARKRGVRVTVLAEDQRLASFGRRVLEKLGFHPREVFVEPIPKSGAGQAWVRKSYPKQVAICRQKTTHQRVALVIGIDADNKSPEARINDLDKELERDGARKRDATDRIAILAPARNIETWFKYFAGEEVDEKTDYKTKVKQPDYKLAADAFVEEFHKYRNNPDDVSTLAALRAAYEEINRILEE